MKLGISSNTYAWAVGVPGAAPEHPLTALGLLKKAQELGVSLVQFGPNLPLDQLPPDQLRNTLRQADFARVDLEIATQGLDPSHLRRQIQFARRIGAILLRTTLQTTDCALPLRTEVVSSLRTIMGDLSKSALPLAIDNGRIPAAELNEWLNPLGSPWIGVALDTATPLAIPEGWQLSVRVLGHRAVCVLIKDFVVQPAAHGMGYTVEGRPAGKGQLNIPWLVDSLAALRVEPSVIVESWTPEQQTLAETIALEAAWAKQSVEYLRRFIAD